MSILNVFKSKEKEDIADESQEEIPVVEKRDRACKHIFQDRCQLHNVAADDECRCSQWE